MKIPGFEYRKEELSTFSNRVGDFIMTLGMELPLVTLGRLKPTNTITWLIHGILLFTMMFAWLFTVGWILMFVGLVIDMVEESFNNMRRR